MMQLLCAPSRDYGAAHLQYVGLPFSCGWCIALGTWPAPAWSSLRPCLSSCSQVKQLWWWCLESYPAAPSGSLLKSSAQVWYPELSVHAALPVDVLTGWESDFLQRILQGNEKRWCYVPSELGLLLTNILPWRYSDGLEDSYLSGWEIQKSCFWKMWPSQEFPWIAKVIMVFVGLWIILVSPNVTPYPSQWSCNTAGSDLEPEFSPWHLFLRIYSLCLWFMGWILDHKNFLNGNSECMNISYFVLRSLLYWIGVWPCSVPVHQRRLFI